LICEFVGVFSKAEQDRITGVLTALGGPSRNISLPRWTVLRDQVGPQPFYIAVDNLKGGTFYGDTPEALVEAVGMRLDEIP
jgi:hypothetical protein